MMTKTNTISDEYGHELAMPGPFHTLDQLKRANERHGHYFFSAESMRFFRSRVAPGVIGGRVFITSEQFQPAYEMPEPRRYTVRVAHDDGSICTLSEFQQFATLAQARAFARKAVQA